jgi:hypothetical protein
MQQFPVWTIKLPEECYHCLCMGLRGQITDADGSLYGCCCYFGMGPRSYLANAAGSPVWA